MVKLCYTKAIGVFPIKMLAPNAVQDCAKWSEGVTRVQDVSHPAKECKSMIRIKLLSSWYLYVQQNLLETLDQGPDFYLWNLVSFFRNHFQDRWIAKKKKVMTWYLCRFNTDIIFLPIWFVHLHNLMLNVALRLLFDSCSVLFYDGEKGRILLTWPVFNVSAFSGNSF